jgi:hypothetical protein
MRRGEALACRKSIAISPIGGVKPPLPASGIPLLTLKHIPHISVNFCCRASWRAHK